MNREILAKYEITFERNESGQWKAESNSLMAIFLLPYRHPDDITNFLNDVEKCISGDFKEVADPDYDNAIFNVYGTLSPGTFELFQDGGKNREVYPITDFKEILLSWKEFITF
jgi:hypothetical protein